MVLVLLHVLGLLCLVLGALSLVYALRVQHGEPFVRRLRHLHRTGWPLAGAWNLDGDGRLPMGSPTPTGNAPPSLGQRKQFVDAS